MQTDFNQFVKDNFNFKKFSKLHIEDITKGGKRDYLPLSEFKALNSELATTVKDEIKKILKNVKKSSSIFGDEKVSFKDYRLLAIKYGKIKIKYLFLRHLTDKTDKRNILDDLKKENDNLKEENDNLKEVNNLNAKTYENEKQKLNFKLQTLQKELKRKDGYIQNQTNLLKKQEIDIDLKNSYIDKLKEDLLNFSKIDKNINKA
jgi:hypothetical protein